MTKAQTKIATGVTIAVVGIALAAYGVATQFRSSKASSQDQNNTDTPSSEPEPNKSPESTPPTNSDGTKPSDQPSANKKTATVIITRADTDSTYLQIRAFTDAYQNGSCTATLTKGTMVKIYAVKTELQPSTTQCNSFQIPKNELPSGTWSLIVTFESSNYLGKSETREVII